MTQAPQFETEGFLELTYGNYDQRIVQGYVTTPLSDAVAFSPSGSVNQRDGYVTNLAGGSQLNARDRWAVRGHVLARPSASLEMRPIADYDRIDEVCCGAVNVVNGPLGFVVEQAGGQILAEDPFARAGYFNPVDEIENAGVSLQADRDLGAANLTSIMAYRDRSSFADLDGDFVSLDTLSETSSDDDIQTFT